MEGLHLFRTGKLFYEDTRYEFRRILFIAKVGQADIDKVPLKEKTWVNRLLAPISHIFALQT